MTSLLKNLELYTSVTAGETLLLAKTKSLTLSHDEARAFLSSKHQWTLSGRMKERDMVKWICLSKPVFPLSWAVYYGHKQNTKWSFNFYSLDLCEVFWLVGVFLVLFVCLFVFNHKYYYTTSQRRVLAEMESSCNWEALWTKSKHEVVNPTGFRVSPSCIPVTSQLHSTTAVPDSWIHPVLRWTRSTQFYSFIKTEQETQCLSLVLTITLCE